MEEQAQISQPLELNYAAARNKTAEWAYWIATVAMGLPLAIGLFCLIAFAISRYEPFALVGFFDLGLGAVGWGMGVIFTIIYTWHNPAHTEEERPLQARRKGVLLLLIFGSIIAAFICTFVGMSLIRLH